jgi:hypothetical protein
VALVSRTRLTWHSNTFLIEAPLIPFQNKCVCYSFDGNLGKLGAFLQPPLGVDVIFPNYSLTENDARHTRLCRDSMVKRHSNSSPGEHSKTRLNVLEARMCANLDNLEVRTDGVLTNVF